MPKADPPLWRGVPFSVARVSPGTLKLLDAPISMSLIQWSAWL